MRLQKQLPIFATLGATMLSVPATAAPIRAAAMLVSSSPTADSIHHSGIGEISLNFAEQAQLVSLTLYMPDDSEVIIYPLDSDIHARPAKAKSFSFKLATPVTKAGRYTISYLLTSKSFKSLNGFIDIEVPDTDSARSNHSPPFDAQ